MRDRDTVRHLDGHDVADGDRVDRDGPFDDDRPERDRRRHRRARDDDQRVAQGGRDAAQPDHRQDGDDQAEPERGEGEANDGHLG